MINCGIQCLVCDFPIHLDTYSGCSHLCKYCFANEKTNIAHIKPLSNASALKSFIAGNRHKETSWCDWNIPIHWGANSDPFQVCELEHGKSLECLRVFAETQYPFIVSTKNPVLLTSEPYFSLLKKCRCVLQISMACGKYDKLETGATSYKDRLAAAETLSKAVTRLIVRVQPFFPDCLNSILAEVQNYAKAGAYGVIVEGYSSRKKQKGLVKDGKWCFSMDLLVPEFKKIRDKCHDNGLRFFCGEDRLRFLGDDLACCGTEGLEDFTPNKFNIEHLAHDDHHVAPTDAMCMEGTTRPFRSRRQTQAWDLHIKNKSFYDMMYEIGDGYIQWYIELRRKYDV